jgi:hypothetical protein
MAKAGCLRGFSSGRGERLAAAARIESFEAKTGRELERLLEHHAGQTLAGDLLALNLPAQVEVLAVRDSDVRSEVRV